MSTRNYLEPAELKALFKAPSLAADEFWTGYFKVQYQYGCRVSEVALLRKTDVAWADKKITIRRLSEKWQPVVYTLPDRLADVLHTVQEFVPEANPWLFGSNRKPRERKPSAGDKMANARRVDEGWTAVSRSTADLVFRRAATEAGLSRELAHTQVLRHTRAVNLLAAGTREADVKALLGHGDVSTTRSYLKAAHAVRAKYGSDLGLSGLI